MKRQFLAALLLLVTTMTTNAGGLLTNTNQNIAFNRNFARLATFEIDGAYSNPAGLAWIGEGFHLSFNIQSAFQNRYIDTKYAPFANGIVNNCPNSLNAAGYKRYKGEASAPIVPSFQGAWQRGDWTLSANFAITGGGGKATFNGGLPMFESQLAGLPALLTAAGVPSDSYSIATYMRGRQFVYGLQFGATYRILNDVGDLHQGLSVYAGARMNYVSNAYEGYIHDISANINGTMTKLSPYFTAASQEATKAMNYYKLQAETAQGAGLTEAAAQAAAAAQQYGVAAATYEAYAGKTRDIDLDCTQSGWGLTPIIGVDYRIGGLNLGMRYEFGTNLNIENDTKVNTTGSADFDNGVNTPNDLPAILSVGAQYDILKNWRVMTGWTYYFDKDCGMANQKQKKLTGNTSEILWGTEWDVNDRLTLSCGGQFTNYGLSDGYQNDLAFSCDSYSLGLGAKVKVSNNVELNAAYFWTTYSDYNTAANTPMPTTYSRTNKVFGAGVNIHF